MISATVCCALLHGKQDTPQDGALVLKTMLQESVCQGESATLIIDTTGTGKLLQPDKFVVSVLNRDAFQKIPSSEIVTFNDSFMVVLKPEKSTEYETTVSYRTGEGDYEQILTATNFIKVYSNPAILSIDSIKPDELDVCLENGTGMPPYEFSVDRGPFFTTNILKGLTEGEHILTVVDARGCMSQKSFMVENKIVSIKDATIPTVSLYPTIVSDKIFVRGAVAEAPYRVISPSGKNVMEGALSDGSVEVASLPSGTYYILLAGKSYPFVKE